MRRKTPATLASELGRKPSAVISIGLEAKLNRSASAVAGSGAWSNIGHMTNYMASGLTGSPSYTFYIRAYGL